MKNLLMSHLVEGKLAEGGPHWDILIEDDDVDCTTDGGTFGRCVSGGKQD